MAYNSMIWADSILKTIFEIIFKVIVYLHFFLEKMY
jgi:hypothetical protein